MKRKNEPLKNKMRTMIGARPLPEFNFFFADDIKSAIQGLLEEIEEAIKYYTIQNALNKSTFRNERIKGLKIAQSLIKKWFPDVCEEAKK